MKTKKKTMLNLRHVRDQALLIKLLKKYEVMNSRPVPMKPNAKNTSLKLSKGGLHLMQKIYRCCMRLVMMNSQDVKARYVIEKMRNDPWLIENGLDVNYVPSNAKKMTDEERVAHRALTEQRMKERYPERWANLVALKEKREKAKQLKLEEMEAHRVWREKQEAFRKERLNYFEGIEQFRLKDEMVSMTLAREGARKERIKKGTTDMPALDEGSV